MFAINSTERVILNCVLISFLFKMGYFWQLLFISSGLIITTYMGWAIMFSISYPDRYIEITKTIVNCMKKVILSQESGSINTTEDESMKIIVSDCKEYYTINGIHYDIAFPLFWVLHENPERGPRNCMNCTDYGTFRGVFIMYCANCASGYNDEGKYVGYGAINCGVEIVCDENKCAWNTYLKDRTLECIGLPEEKDKIDFNREGYIYTLCTMDDENGVNQLMYPNFVEEEDEEEDDEEDEEEDEEEDDTVVANYNI